MSAYAKELVREALGFARCGYVDVESYGRLVGMVDGLLALESEANDKLEGSDLALCVCGHSANAHGNDGVGHCGEKPCRFGLCRQFRVVDG